MFVVVLESLEEHTIDHDTHDIFNIAGMPMAIASIAFSYGGNSIYAQIEEGMREPNAFPRVLSAAMATVCVFYAVTAFSGYFAFGRNTLSPVLQNLPLGPGKVISMAVITVHVLFAAPIFLMTFARESERSIPFMNGNVSLKTLRLRIIGFRSLIMLILTTVALFMPFFSDIVSLLGAFSNTLLIFVSRKLVQ